MKHSKIDMHCHVKGGSIDSHVSMETYIHEMKVAGLDGFLVTDHDSYRGFRKWAEANGVTGSSYVDEDGFTVLCGIEYDTRDAGHYLVILPEGIRPKGLTIRGMSVTELISVVHGLGGVLGPAHPFGARSSSAMFCLKMKKNPDLVKEFDFVEGLNTCEKLLANESARALAEEFGLPCTAGSDAHREKYIATVYTEFDREIKSTDDLIAAIKEGGILSIAGKEREFLFRHHFRNIPPTTYGFKLFNRGLGAVYIPRRKKFIASLYEDAMESEETAEH